MRLQSAIAFLTLLALAFAADAAPTPSPRQVDIPLSSGIFHAQLYKPDGASALLWAVRPQLPPRNIEPDFRSAIAFYPDCRISSGLGWSARVPTLLLIGAKDDVSSPPACRQMVDGARGRSALARIVVYPGAYHDFDRANFPLHAIGSTSDAGLRGKGHVGTDR